MRRIFFGSFLITLLFGLSPLMAAAVAAEDLPKPFTFARYQGMKDRSPFAVATKVEAPAEAPNFAKDLYIANAARSKEGDHVTIASSTDKMFKKYLTSGMPFDGYKIVNIEWSEKVGATKVTISKDGQTATLGFNEALLRQPGQGGGQNPSAAAPPAFQPQSAELKEKQQAAGNQAATSAAAVPPPGAQQTQTKPMPVPMVPTPQPRVRGVIPRNPGS